MMYFAKPGIENTEKSLNIALEEAEKRGIKYVVAASTWGATAEQAARIFKGKGIKLVIVTHNTGFKKPGDQEFKEESKRIVEEMGGIVYTGTMVTRGLGTAIRTKRGFSLDDIVSDTLRLFCQGAKVCLEIAAMACDAGLVPPEDIITVAGTGKGADTVFLVKADSSNNFFNMKVREILAKPSDF